MLTRWRSRSAQKTDSKPQKGKFPPVHDEWGIIFMESINVTTETELFPFFTEIGTDPTYCRTRIRLLDNSGKELSTMLRRVNPVKVKPGKYILIGEGDLI